MECRKLSAECRIVMSPSATNFNRPALPDTFIQHSAFLGAKDSLWVDLVLMLISTWKFYGFFLKTANRFPLTKAAFGGIIKMHRMTDGFRGVPRGSAMFF